MSYNKNAILHNYLANMKLDAIISMRGECPDNWGGENQIKNSNVFYYIIDGNGFIKVNGEVIYPKKGDLVLIPKGAVVTFGVVDNKPYNKYWCHFKLEYENTNMFDFLNLPLMVEVGEDEKIKQAFEIISNSNNKNDILSAFQTQAYIMLIITYFIEQAINQGNDIVMRTNKPLSYIIKYIDKNYQRDISIDDLAQMAHLHPNYFIKSFKNSYGTTPMHYVNNLRLEKAKYELSATSKTIQEIAILCGFSDQFQFSKAFKRVFDISPSFYRKYNSLK